MATIRCLRELGCHVTLLHFSAENPHGWADDFASIEASRREVDEFINYYPRDHIWTAPKQDGYHKLDEWIDEEFLVFVNRLTRRRHFDLAVINNVWMSKIFDSLPPYVIRLNDTHDVFYRRRRAFEVIKSAPDFFSCTKADEAFGWRRAHVNLAITNEERLLMCQGAPNRTNLHLPFIEPLVAPKARDYLHADKVVFGFLGSAHPFNIHGIISLIESLKIVARWAPIEVLVAGNVTKSLSSTQRRYVKTLGYVEEVSEFYDQIDICISPVDLGSGLKIKVVEALSRGFPVIATKHSAEGCDLISQLVVSNVTALAHRMGEIASERPNLNAYYNAIALSQKSLLFRYRRQQVLLEKEITKRQCWVVVNSTFLTAPATDPALWLVLGLVRELSHQGQVVLNWPNERPAPNWLKMMPPTVRLTGEALCHNGECRNRVSLSRLVETGVGVSLITDDPDFRIPAGAYKVLDNRFKEGISEEVNVALTDLLHELSLSDAEKSVYWSHSITWDPVIPRINRNSEGVNTLSVRFGPRKNGPDGECAADAEKTGQSDISATDVQVDDLATCLRAIALAHSKGFRRIKIETQTRGILEDLFIDWCEVFNVQYDCPGIQAQIILDSAGRAAIWGKLVYEMRRRGMHERSSLTTPLTGVNSAQQPVPKNR